jgi:phosphatidate cytidylyltransferase
MFFHWERLDGEVAPAAIWWAMAAVWLFVGVCTVVGFAHPVLRRPEKKGVRQAITSWWPVTIAAALGTLCGPVATVVVYSGIGVLLAREALLLLGLPKENWRHSVVVVGGLVCAQHGFVVVGGPIAGHALSGIGPVVVVALLVVPAAQLWRFGPAGFVRAVTGSLWAFLVAGLLFSFCVRIVVDAPGPRGGPGAGYVFFVLVMMSDAMQYVWGKAVGRTPLAPLTSPKKTREGFVGGALTTAVVGAVIVPPMLERSALTGAALGLAFCATGLVGDLVMSAWKRDAGVKDSGALLAGQGGALDRCDSIVFCAPLFWWWLQP